MSTNTTATLLIEIGTEELPPTRLDKLANAFAKSLQEAFDSAGITYEKIETFVTPRRIAARFSNVPSHQPSRSVQKKGPSLSSAFDAQNQPTRATEGFARSIGVNVDALTPFRTDQGAWLVYTLETPGQPLSELLGPFIEKALEDIPAPKRMRWGNETLTFLRPLHWIVVLHGTTALPVKVFHLTATGNSYGHRVHHPDPVKLTADHYIEKLLKAYVIADYQSRQHLIREGIEKLAKKHQGQAIIDPALLDQVTGLVEWPVPLDAHFDKAFLAVPSEALISSMQHHQKCFPIKNKEALLSAFILISNTQANPPDNIIRGNERVMEARLADAKFFYDQDRKMSLASRLNRLKKMIFHKKLGSLYDKSHRIAKLAGQLAPYLNAPIAACERAAKLSKADLLTEMVFEFPELQGIMGNYYAKHDGEPEEVALAIQESYFPRFSKDTLPASPIGLCVALADRLDTLVGIFGIHQIPTGDKDPFALRRQSLAILRILIEKALPLDLLTLLKMAQRGYGVLIDEDVLPQIVTFCFERFKTWYQEQGITVHTLEAVMTLAPIEPYDCSRRLLAIAHFQTLPEAQHLISANKRVRNLLQKSDLTFNLQQLPPLSPALLKEPAEKALFDAIEALKIQVTPLIMQGKYQAALITLAGLQQSVDHFFDTVLVMAEDETLKQNRIHLLCHLYALFMQIADISKLIL